MTSFPWSNAVMIQEGEDIRLQSAASGQEENEGSAQDGIGGKPGMRAEQWASKIARPP